MNKRMEWVDVLKGIGIFLVVLGHNQVSNYLGGYITSFHMPLFFLISGLLYNSKKYNKFKILAESRLKTIIIPFLIFSLISLFMSYGRNFIKPTDINLIEVINRFIITGIIESNPPLWFLRTLFVVEIAFYFLKKYIKNDLVLFICLVVFLLISFNGLFNTPHEIVLCLNGLFFYGIGNIIKDKINNSFKWLSLLTFAIIHIFIVLKCIKNDIQLSISSTDHFIYFILASSLGIITVYILSRFIDKNSILEYMGKNSIIILCTHIIVKDVISIFSTYVLKVPKSILTSESNLNALVLTTIILIISIPIIEIINNYFPFIIGKNKKNNEDNFKLKVSQ